MNVSQVVKQAITLARAGQRAQAQQLLLQVVEVEPRHELAWIWLSELVPELEDKIIALENALTINPNRPKVQRRLRQLQQRLAELTAVTAAPAQYEYDWERETAVLQEAIAHHQQGMTQAALKQLRTLVKSAPSFADGWWELATISTNEKEKTAALQQLLRLHPEHQEAQRMLQDLQLKNGDLLSQAKAHEEAGQIDKAIHLYAQAAANAATSSDRHIARRRQKTLKEQQAAMQPPKATSPQMTVARMVVGPPILYGLLIFVQSGLNPLHLSPLLCLAGLLVLAGSFTAVATIYTPAMSTWQWLTGQERLNARWQLGLSVVGYLAIILPFIIFLINAANRMNQAGIQP